MPRRCSVKGCKSNYDSEIKRFSTFTLPKDNILKMKWLLNIRTDFSHIKTPFICEKHFLPEDIIRVDRVISNGELKEFPRILPKLKDGAIPSIFSSHPASLTTQKSKAKRFEEEHLERLGSVVPQEEKVDNNPLEPTVVIKEEPPDDYATPSTSTATDPTASEEFILPHEDSSKMTPKPVVEPHFTLSLACLAPDTNDSEQSTKKRKANNLKIVTHVPSTNDLAASDEHDLGELSNPGSSKSKDQFDIFGEYIAAKLRNLDLVSCAFAQKAIGDIIFEAELGKYRNQMENVKS